MLLLAPAAATAGDLPAQNCDISGCGGNTPIVYASPIEGLRPGVANHRGIILEPTVERVAPAPTTIPANQVCPDGATIDVYLGQLVCRSGHFTFSGQGLIGIALTLRIPPFPCDTHSHTPLPSCPPLRDLMQVRVRIDEVSSVETWEVQNPSSVVTYKMVWHELEDAEQLEEDLVLGESICPLQRAWMDPGQNPRSAGPQVQRPDANGWDEENDHLLIVHGETYLSDGTILNSGAQATEWFNLGCVGSALAKMRLLGINPILQQGELAYRAATLKMLTGRYRGERSYTSPGMPLHYQHVNGKQFWGQPFAPISPHVEAYWAFNGATCVSHRRTWQMRSLEVGKYPMSQYSAWMAAARPEGDLDGVFPLLPPNPDFVALYLSGEEASLNEEIRPLPFGIPTCTNMWPNNAYWLTRPVNHAH